MPEPAQCKAPRVAIMQPYFLPYIGYFQLLTCADRFVVYDNVEFTKKGWIQRNRILDHGSPRVFTIPVAHASDTLHVCEREIAVNSNRDRQKILNVVRNAYRRAPFFDDAYPLVEECVMHSKTNLFDFILHSLKAACSYLQMTPSMAISSHLDVDHSLKGQDRVIAICQHEGAATYVNPIGGVSLYDSKSFSDAGIDLAFLRVDPDLAYRQFGNPFEPNLSIVDVMMFNSVEDTRKMLSSYSLIG